ncbi:hypothetical protein NQ315_015755 [Exocentrus adspersus]|uniref:Uncharacterized protein n=1 Tax=Exocentrus adspersus TaxID=1586481 RepID=A0AAV8W4E1_9CUCU|nr:hypothetical protein NQ315_015755 [Exocentrus adspersus]
MFREVTIVFAFILLFRTQASSAANGIVDKFADTLKINPKLTLKTCQTQTGATNADLESVKMRKVPQTKTGRCFVQCLFGSVRLVEDGKFSKQGMVLAFAPAMKGDLTKVGKLRKLSEVCEKEMRGKKFENCDGAEKIVECVARNGKAYGIEFPKDRN